MTNVLLLGSSLGFGGAERIISSLARHLDPAAWNVSVGHLKESGTVGDELRADGFNVVPIAPRPGRIRRYLSFTQLAQTARHLRIDVIHSHSTYALMAACLAKLLRYRSVKIVHTFHFGNYPRYPLRYRVAEYLCARIADRLVAVGRHQASRINATYRLAPGELKTIMNGVDEPVGLPDADWHSRLRNAGKAVIGTIATFIEQKGLPDFLEAARRICIERDDVLFVIVGDGPLRQALERQCAQAGLSDKVQFAGWKTNAGTTMMPLFDVFVQSSSWEAMSVVVLEAMAAARPVVVTSVGDNAEVVMENKTGFVVEPGDLDGMCRAVCRLLDRPEMRASFGSAARNRHLERYTARHMAREYQSVYAECLAARPDLSR